jgi:hypothetical protein
MENTTEKTVITYGVIYEYNNEKTGISYEIPGLTTFYSYKLAKSISEDTASELMYISVKLIYVKEIIIPLKEA